MSMSMLTQQEKMILTYLQEKKQGSGWIGQYLQEILQLWHTRKVVRYLDHALAAEIACQVE